jgi:acyl-CoA thioester hydrolase
MTIHKTKFRVIYGDTDKMGIAYYANYLRWFEVGRTEFFRSLGLTYREMEAQGIFLPVSEAHCKYLAPARYDDSLTIETALDPGIRAGVRFDYRILADDGDRVHAEGYTRHACVDGDGRVVRPPGFLRELIAENR